MILDHEGKDVIVMATIEITFRADRKSFIRVLLWLFCTLLWLF